MASHRRIDAAGLVHFRRADDLLVERLPHAMQALELEAAVIARHDRDGRQRMGIVGCELRIELRAVAKQVAGTGKVADIGGDLAGKQRIAGEALFLRALHLGVPVGALDQPDRNAPPRLSATCASHSSTGFARLL